MICPATAVIIAALARRLTCLGLFVPWNSPDWLVSGHMPRYKAKLVSDSNRSKAPISPASSATDVLPKPGMVPSRLAISDLSDRGSMALSSPPICFRSSRMRWASVMIILPTYSTSKENFATFCHSLMMPAYFLPAPGILRRLLWPIRASFVRSFRQDRNRRNHRLEASLVMAKTRDRPLGYRTASGSPPVSFRSPAPDAFWSGV